jgi:serine protease AprX
MLTSTARPGISVLETEVGKGTLDIWAAASAGPGTANQGLAVSTGMGSLDLSRGTLLVDTTDIYAVTILGIKTQQLLDFNQIEFVSTEWTGASWHDSQWAGASWHGASWHGASWHGASWHGASWHGASWHNADGTEPDYGTGWLGSAIYGAWG